MNIISLGAGVQSSTMALMAAKGEITPMPVAAIFADTQDEAASVYRWLEWLEKQLPFPVIHASRGKLSEAVMRVRTSAHGTRYTKHGLPAYSMNKETGKIGIMPRQCTADFKIEVIQREIRVLLPDWRRGEKCIQWIGISIDEADRMKPSRRRYIENRWPLIEKEMTRQRCLLWMKKNGYPPPPRSACIYCPFHSDAEWLRLKREEPQEFQKAIEIEKRYQEAMHQTTGFKGIPYFHRSGKPLSLATFGTEQGDFFSNECEGQCGL